MTNSPDRTVTLVCCRRCGLELAYTDGPTLRCGNSLFRHGQVITCPSCGSERKWWPRGLHDLGDGVID